MTRTIPVLCGVVLLIGSDRPAADANKKDLEAMQGDWAAVSITHDGYKLPDDDAQSLFRTVKGDQYTVFLFKKAISKGTLKVDATKKPKTIDFVPADTGAKSEPILGIYELEGDSWKICYALPGKERPKELTSKKGSGHALAVWEREKK
jgi:uncharacterized protein (TIGR03067 family)